MKPIVKDFKKIVLPDRNSNFLTLVHVSLLGNNNSNLRVTTIIRIVFVVIVVCRVVLIPKQKRINKNVLVLFSILRDIFILVVIIKVTLLFQEVVNLCNEPVMNFRGVGAKITV